MKVSRFVGLFFGLGLAVSAHAAPDPNFHIYLAFGQSNMEGQGDVGSQDKTVDERFQVLWAANNGSCSGKTKGKWATAVPPLAHCQGAKLGPTDYFGRTMVEKTDSKIKVGVIVVAVAGCSIQLFDKDGYANYARSQQSWMTQRINEYGGNPYGRLIEMAKKAQEDGVIKGIIFHQGETDAGDGQWPSKVKKVYDNIIKDLGLGNDVPFLAGEVLRSGSSKGANNNIAKLPQQSKNFYVVSSEGFNQALGDGQNVHFTSQEYRDFGKRYAEKMIEVLGDKIKPVSEASSSSSKGSVAEESSSSVARSSSSRVRSSSSRTHRSSDSHNSSSSTAGAVVIGNAAPSLNVGKVSFDHGYLNVPVMLARSGDVKIRLYSVLGHEVAGISESMKSGTNNVYFSREKIPSGVYMLSVQSASSRITKRLDLSK
ncbi:MAG: T9SS type A sorting domain-containing protein [Fibrobacter sp.]|uniref:sialate O-acetylesterase n=1 Tax=Fibrobacter sp. TaxID=35828 RepID=UPI0025BF76BF|nr:sialate O-acetylesterase [Fibrobacter sp.]MBQ7081592.1 T9SS type A sorting domain-containing protein [Fibrobacter sp.]